MMTNLEGTGAGASGQTAGPMTSSPRLRAVDAGNRVTAIIPGHPVELGQPLRITLKLRDPHVIGIGEVQGEGDHTFTNISSGFAVGTGDARIVGDTGPTKTMEVIPLGVGKLTFGIMVFFADGGIARKNYTLEVAPSSKGLKDFFLNHGSHALAIVLEDKPEDRQRWLSPEVAYRQLEYPIYLENSGQIKFTVQQAADKPVILLDPNGLVHGLRPGKATIIGDFDGVKDEVVVTVYTKESACWLSNFSALDIITSADLPLFPQYFSESLSANDKTGPRWTHVWQFEEVSLTVTSQPSNGCVAGEEATAQGLSGGGVSRLQRLVMLPGQIAILESLVVPYGKVCSGSAGIECEWQGPSIGAEVDDGVQTLHEHRCPASASVRRLPGFELATVCEGDYSHRLENRISQDRADLIGLVTQTDLEISIIQDQDHHVVKGSATDLHRRYDSGLQSVFDSRTAGPCLGRAG